MLLLAAALGPALSQLHSFDMAKAPVRRLARCTMRLHNDGTEIGDVEFWSDGTVQQMEARLESPAIKEGNHGLHIHRDRVQGYDCGSTSGHYNPTYKDHGSPLSFDEGRHAGDFGNVRADAKGRVNWQSKFVVRVGGTNHATLHIEPLLLEKRGSKGRKQKKGKKGKGGKAKKNKGGKGKGKKKNKPFIDGVPSPEIAIQPVPEIAVQPIPEPEIAIQPVPEIAVQPIPEPEIAIQPVPEIAVQPIPEPEIAIQPVPEIAVQPIPEPEIAIQPVPEIAVQPIPEPEIAIQPVPEIAVQPIPEPEIAVQPVPEEEEDDYYVPPPPLPQAPPRPAYMFYARYLVNSPRFTLEGDQSIVGRSVVLHDGTDDEGKGGDDGSKATGNAGSRVACCTLVEV